MVRTIIGVIIIIAIIRLQIFLSKAPLLQMGGDYSLIYYV